MTQKSKIIPFDKERALKKDYISVFLDFGDELRPVEGLTYFKKADQFAGVINNATNIAIFQANGEMNSFPSYELRLEVLRKMVYVAVYYYKNQPDIFYSLVYSSEESAKDSVTYQDGVVLLKVVEVEVD